jgi:hypothetical protein
MIYEDQSAKKEEFLKWAKSSKDIDEINLYYQIMKCFYTSNLITIKSRGISVQLKKLNLIVNGSSLGKKLDFLVERGFLNRDMNSQISRYSLSDKYKRLENRF